MRVKKEKGFTLIELLVVISVIGFLATLAIVSLNDIRTKTRDAKRKADLQQIAMALKLYANDHGGQLPIAGFGYLNQGNGWATNYKNGVTCYTGYGDLEDFLDGTDADIPDPKNAYLQKTPKDPKNGGCNENGNNPSGYMYYHPTGIANCSTVFAALEKPTAQDSASCAGKCYPLGGLDTTYGMNYCIDIRP